MWNIKYKLGLYLRTFKQIGYIKLFRKNLFNLRLNIFQFLPEELLLFLIGYRNIRLKEKKQFFILNQPKLFTKESNFSSKYIDIYLLENKYRLFLPIDWQRKNWSRLFKFYLHYFDWIRVYIDSSLQNQKGILSSFEVNYLIDSWIDNNKLANGDGWHPYPTSLRIINWSILFQIFPGFKNKKRVSSLWKQLLWLHLNLERAQGGNHLIENLIALCMVSIQFENAHSKNIFKSSLLNLQSELNSQILNDGGHCERSATYHSILLDKLIELGCLISISEGSVPFWLRKKIGGMSKWLKKVSFINNKLPRFNDSALNSSPKASNVNISADIFLKYSNNFENKNLGLLRSLLLKKALGKNNSFKSFENYKEDDISNIYDLPETGWVIFNPGLGWEASFKNGEATSLNNSGHCQSDILSFDLLFNGEFIFVDAGTSEYEPGPRRTFERSGRAHNVLQIGSRNKNWIEPVEVWGGFKVGRISKNIYRKCGIGKNGELYAEGGYDSYKSLGAFHTRKIECSEVTNNSIKIKIEDKVTCKNKIYCRLIFHLGPKVDYQKVQNALNITTSPNLKYKINSDKTHFSEGFGDVQSRRSLYYDFTLEKGVCFISSIIYIESSFLLRNSFEESMAD
tara:strand:+ start:22390 stop:24261 length:1872 start_codon:yes stop_codon:yes gene_type:complete